MSLLKQKKPEFKSRQDILDYIEKKEVSLQFWGSLKTVDMTEMIEDIRKDIEEVKRLID